MRLCFHQAIEIVLGIMRWTAYSRGFDEEGKGGKTMP